MPQFIKDVQELRRRAEQKMEDGAVTQSYKGDVNKTIDILNEALATEIVCVLRYMHHYFMATGVHGAAARDEFKEHASDLSDLLYITNPETGKTEGQDPGTDALNMGNTQQQPRNGGNLDQGKTATLQTGNQTDQGQKQPEDHSKERNRILNELRRMGDKKNKPAA